MFRTFSSTFMSDIGLQLSFLVMSFFWFCYKGNTGLWECIVLFSCLQLSGGVCAKFPSFLLPSLFLPFFLPSFPPFLSFSLFHFLFFSFLFLSFLLPWLEVSVQCWIEVAKMNILVFLLILGRERVRFCVDALCQVEDVISYF